MGLYYIFIKDLLDVFPRSQVFVFRLEDYSKDRLKWLQDIFSFLGLGKNFLFLHDISL